MQRLHVALFIFLMISVGCRPGKSRIPIIIDADTANEVDDLFALARALSADEFELLGITSAQFHISPLASDSSVWESQQLNELLVTVMDRQDVPTLLGSNEPLKSKNIPQRTEASDFIVAQALKHSTDRPLNLVILGPCTNVASAILQNPVIVPNIRVHYIGFWHDPKTNSYNLEEFNTGNDSIAANVLLNQPNLDLDIMSATTCQHLVMHRREAERYLQNTGEIGTMLLNRWDSYDRWWTSEDPEKQQWIMWDLAIIEALLRNSLAKKELFRTPPGNLSREIEIYTEIDVPAMNEDFQSAIQSKNP